MQYLLYTETFPSRRVDATRHTGIGRYCADLADGLTGLGHDVTVLTNTSIGATEPAAPGGPRVEILGDLPQGRLAMLARARVVRDRIRAHAPQHVLVGDPLAHAVLSTVPMRSPRPLCPILYGTEIADWSRALGRGRSQAWLPRWRLERYLGTSIPVCISRFTAGLLRDLDVGAPPECIVYPCVSTGLLDQPVDRRLTDAVRQRAARDGVIPPILCTVARISERKNQLAVLQALYVLVQGGGLPWHYLVVGNVDATDHADYFACLRGFVTDHGLAERVTFVHHATDADKVGYLDACDAAVMLSRSVGASVEGFGISVIEASARGRVAIVSDQGGMPETIEDGTTGYVVPPDAIDRLASVLGALALDPARRAAMGAAGRRRVLERFTPAATAARLDAQLADRLQPVRTVPANVARTPALARGRGQES